MKDKTQSPGMARSAERVAAARDPLRIAARSFARALGQSAASSGEYLSILDRGRALAANGVCRAMARQACRGGSRELPRRGEWSAESSVDDVGWLNEVLTCSCDESAPRHPPLLRAGAACIGMQAFLDLALYLSPAALPDRYLRDPGRACAGRAGYSFAWPDRNHLGRNRRRAARCDREAAGSKQWALTLRWWLSPMAAQSSTTDERLKRLQAKGLIERDAAGVGWRAPA
jgi:hypothetical protein